MGSMMKMGLLKVARGSILSRHLLDKFFTILCGFPFEHMAWNLYGRMHMKKSWWKENIVSKKSHFLIVVICVSLVFLIAAFKYRSGDIGYLNSDATWHTLLTVISYDETPISQHLFLPIVSLGSAEDKFIPWGATIPDEQGNYYYTSFSPAGYFLPWLFFKIGNLPATEASLYLFNTCLFAVSAAMWALFVKHIYDKHGDGNALAVIALLTYVFAPGLLHGMGITYWHQSVMQVTLLAQVIAYCRFKETGSKSSQAIFFILCILNPYIEWTGFVGNVGFALAELMDRNWRSVKRTFAIAGTTVIAFVLFCGHYLLRTDKQQFFEALCQRFLARSVQKGITLERLGDTYLQSFQLVLIIFVILVVWNFMLKKRVEIYHGRICLILAFPCLENIVMMSHAISYPYDCMKGIFLLSFLIVEMSHTLIEKSKKSRYSDSKIVCAAKSRFTAPAIIVLCLALGLVNLNSYRNDERYIWTAGYRANNMVVAEYINQNYPDSALGTPSRVRGYMNLLFGRGIYGGETLETISEIAAREGKQYGVLITARLRDWSMDEILGARIVDVQSGKEQGILQAAPATDEGQVAVENKNVIAFCLEQQECLQDAKQLTNGQKTIEIVKVEEKGDYLYVECASEVPPEFAYPNVIMVCK